MTADYKIIVGDVRDSANALENESIQTIITSPPYWAQRDYGVDGQIGLETSPEEFITELAGIFDSYKAKLSKDGTIFVNLADSYFNSTFIRKKSADAWANKGDGDAYDSYYAKNGGGVSGGKRRSTSHEYLKPKSLSGIPWKFAEEMQRRGWILRADIIWSKTNPMPEPVKDRPSKTHEYIFMFTKSRKYKYDKTRHELGKKTVWELPTSRGNGVHFATFPESLVEPMVLCATDPGDIVLDPFCGSGTTGVVSVKQSRKFIGIELNSEYAKYAESSIEAGKR